MPLKAFKCSGMQNILNGFLRYRSKLKDELAHTISQNPSPQAVIVTCVDSRIVASRITQTVPGETFITRNPGSILPNYNVLNPKTPRPEEAALELACLYNKIDTMVLAGHSDCKAMNLVYDNRKNANDHKMNGKESVLKSWLMSNSGPTIQKYAELEKHDFKKPIKFNITDNYSFEAYIDPENEYENHDRFSQLNTLCQLENLKHYKFLRNLLDDKRIEPYAMWLDIYCGDVLVFSFKEKRFISLNENTYPQLAASFNAAQV